MKKYWFIWMAFVVAAFSTQAQNASALLDHNEIKIGEQTSIELTLRFPAAEKSIMMPALQDTITKFIEVIEVSNIDTTFDEEDITTKIFTQKITITSWDSGMHVIPPFKFVFGNDTLLSEPLLLTVNTIPLQADQDIKDIKDIMEVPFSLMGWILAHKLPIGLTLLAIVLTLVGIILYRKYLNTPKTEEKAFVPKEAADIVANRKLDELKNKKLWQKGDVKEYYSELSYILREYIENRFQLRALELTTDETIALSKGISEIEKREKSKLEQVLMLADMAKFAKQQPIATENEEALKNAYLFIEQTALKAIAEEGETEENFKDITTKAESENA